MIATLKQNIKYKHFIALTLVYLSSQWFLLIASGRWVDDWVYADKNWEYLWDVFCQSSIPLHAIIDAGLWLFPDWFYRVVTFALYYGGTILFYKILEDMELFSEDARLWVALLYIVMPVNDTRITWICYGYSLGLFLFWVSFYLAVIWRKKAGWQRIILHILSLFFLLVSFDTESIMIFTLLILLYFYYMDLTKDMQRKGLTIALKKLPRSVLNHADYLIAPIAWYFFDKILFPGYGVYGGHSYVNWNALDDIILFMPRNALVTLKDFILSYVDLVVRSQSAVKGVVISIIVYSAIVIIGIIRNKYAENSSDSLIKNGIMFLLGCIVFFIGFFPYGLKRDESIKSHFFIGRDSLLLGVGTALMFYYGLMSLFRRHIAKIILLSLIVLGIFHFNLSYIDWQEDYYKQLQFQHEIANNDNIINNDTFLVLGNGKKINTEYFYEYNGNSWEVTGEQTRYYAPGTSSLKSWMDLAKDSPFLAAYAMRNYDYSEKTIDGIVFLNYSEVDRKTVLKQKFNELFNKDAFIDWIDEIENKEIKYTSITKEESNDLLELAMEDDISYESLDNMLWDKYYIW